MPAKKVIVDPASIAVRQAHRAEFAGAPPESIFPVDVVATVVGNTPATLELWRSVGRGPRFVKLGRSVRYRKRDVERWLAEQGAADDDGDPPPRAAARSTSKARKGVRA
jgi:predicted DNA-binding transcriptional regulator AlpA